MPENRCDDELLMSCGIGPLWLGDDVVARTHCAVERRRPKIGVDVCSCRLARAYGVAGY
jgi:hypothetical protein